MRSLDRLGRRVGQLLQVFYFIGRQRSSMARAHAAQGQPADARAHEFPHVVPEAGQGAPDLTIAALADRDLQRRPRAAAPDDPHLGRARAPLGQPHAATQPPQVVRRNVAGHRGHVGLGHFVARVGQAVGKEAVIRHQQQALGIGVEPPHGEEARLRVVLHQVDRPRAARRVEVRAHDALGLIEEPVLGALRMQARAVQANVLRLGVGLGPEFGHDPAVDHDTAGGDDVLARAA